MSRPRIRAPLRGRGAFDTDSYTSAVHLNIRGMPSIGKCLFRARPIRSTTDSFRAREKFLPNEVVECVSDLSLIEMFQRSTEISDGEYDATHGFTAVLQAIA